MYRTQGNMFLLHSIYAVVVGNSLSEFGCYGSGFCLLIHGDSFRGELSVVYFPRLLISCWLGVLNDPRRSFCPSKTRPHDEDGAVSEGNGACAADREENSLGWLPSIYGSCCPTVARPVGKLNKTTRLHPPLCSVRSESPVEQRNSETSRGGRYTQCPRIALRLRFQRLPFQWLGSLWLPLISAPCKLTKKPSAFTIAYWVVTGYYYYGAIYEPLWSGYVIPCYHTVFNPAQLFSNF